MRHFENKTAIITGGASGIGRAVGEELARLGARLVLADIVEDRAREAAEAIRTAGGRATAAALDVTDAAAVEALVNLVVEEHGTLDLMFNNAGIVVVGEARDHTLDDWYRTLDVNLRGVVHGVHAAYPVMLRQGHGHIVNTASLAGLIPAADEIAYVASKHAVVGLSTTLRAEAADLGVKVSVVCPGFVDTPILFENMTLKDTDGLDVKSRDDVKKLIGVKAMPVDKAAQVIVAGIRRNKAYIVVTPHAQVLWRLARLHPDTIIALTRRLVRDRRRLRPHSKSQ